jgi:hypothetical protein
MSNFPHQDAFGQNKAREESPEDTVSLYQGFVVQIPTLPLFKRVIRDVPPDV